VQTDCLKSSPQAGDAVTAFKSLCSSDLLAVTIPGTLPASPAPFNGSIQSLSQSFLCKDVRELDSFSSTPLCSSPQFASLCSPVSPRTMSPMLSALHGARVHDSSNVQRKLVARTKIAPSLLPPALRREGSLANSDDGPPTRNASAEIEAGGDDTQERMLPSSESQVLATSLDTRAVRRASLSVDLDLTTHGFSEESSLPPYDVPSTFKFSPSRFLKRVLQKNHNRTYTF